MLVVQFTIEFLCLTRHFVFLLVLNDLQLIFNPLAYFYVTGSPYAHGSRPRHYFLPKQLGKTHRFTYIQVYTFSGGQMFVGPQSANFSEILPQILETL